MFQVFLLCITIIIITSIKADIKENLDLLKEIAGKASVLVCFHSPQPTEERQFLDTNMTYKKENSSIYKVSWHPTSSLRGQHASGQNSSKLG